MKVKKIIFLIFLASVLLFVLSACSSTINEFKDDKDGTEEVYTIAEEKYVTFDEAIYLSDTAVIGEYIEMIQHDFYIEYKFEVIECLYGDVTENVIFLYSDIGISTVSETGYTYEIGNDIYEEGAEYILITNKLESIMYDHDRYVPVTYNIHLCENGNEYTLYSEPIEIPNNMTMADYICSIYASSARPINESLNVTDEIYINDVDEMIGEAEYIGEIQILELYVEGEVHNGNTYRCSVKSLLKGSDLNTYSDGTILVVIRKNTVEVGDSYVIGFSSLDENSLIYTQTTLSSVYEASEELLTEIEQATYE